MTTARGRSRSRSRSPSSSGSSGSRSTSTSSSSTEEGELPRDYDFGPRYDPATFAAFPPLEQNQFINQQRQCNRRNMLLLERRRGELIRDAHRALRRQRQIMWRELDAFKASLAVPVRERAKKPPPQQTKQKPKPKKTEQPPQQPRKRARSPSPPRSVRQKSPPRRRSRSPPRPVRRRSRSPRSRLRHDDDFERQQAAYMRGIRRRAPSPPPSQPAQEDPEERPLNISLVGGPSFKEALGESDRRIVSFAPHYDEDDVPCYSGEDCEV
jgi:hypothetical protein